MVRRLDLDDAATSAQPTPASTPAPRSGFRRARTKQTQEPQPAAKSARVEQTPSVPIETDHEETAGVEDAAGAALFVRMNDTDSESNDWSDEDYFPDGCDSGIDTDAELPDEWCHVSRAFVASPDHDYGKKGIEISFDIEVDEIDETLDNNIIGILSEAMEEYSFAASAIRRRSTEIKERHLSKAEKDAFRVAKHREWGSWLDNKVVDLVSRKLAEKNPPKQILGSRWVLTWKSSKDCTEPVKRTATVKVHGIDVDLKEMSTVKGKTAKARLVLLGYQDPEFTRLVTASPTLGRSTRSILLAMSAHNAWPVRSLDARTAFLSGEANKSRSRPLYMRLPRIG